jgi:very-short-patch-repair endonuclease
MTKLFNKSSEKTKRKMLRNNMPKAEIILWSKIRNKQLLKLKFRRQYSIGPFVLDFYCPEIRLAIEIDGDSHFQEEEIEYDKERQRYIEDKRIKFLRFTNEDVYKNINEVLNDIAKNTPPPTPSL